MVIVDADVMIEVLRKNPAIAAYLRNEVEAVQYCTVSRYYRRNPTRSNKQREFSTDQSISQAIYHSTHRSSDFKYF